MELVRLDLEAGRDEDPIRIEADDDADTAQPVLLGRGPVLGLTDVSLSRQAAKLQYKNKRWHFSAGGKKGAWHVKVGGHKKRLSAEKGETALLGDGEQIWLCQDKYKYRVRLSRWGNDENDASVENHGEKAEPKPAAPPTTSSSKPRTLPLWMQQLQGSPQSPVKKDVKGGKNTSPKMKKPQAESPNKTRTPSPKKPSPRKGGASAVCALSDSEGEAVASSLSASPSSKQPRPDRSSPNKAALAATRHLISDDESDEDLPTTSPYKASPRSSPKSSKSPSPKKAARHDISDDDSSVPNTPRKKGSLKKKTSPSPAKKRMHEMSDDDDEDEEGKTNGAAERKQTKFPKLINKEDFEDSEDLLGDAVGNIVDDGDEAESSVGTSTRPLCRFGATCYRKNPQHRIDEAHPGDADYKEAGDTDDEEADGGDDDDRPECEYGTECFRKNPQHRKDFKHTRKPRPPKRRAAAKAGKKKKAKAGGLSDNSDDESYESSFIDDDESVAEDISNDEMSEEEWLPNEDSE